MRYYGKINNDNVIPQSKTCRFDYANGYDKDCITKELNTTNYYSIGTPELSIGKYQWCSIYNPKKSKKTIYLDETVIANFSSSAAIESIYLRPEISYDGLQYMYGKPLSLDLIHNSEGVILMYQGNNDFIVHNESNSIRIIKPFSIDTIRFSGKIAIPPSKSVLFCISSTEVANPSSSFTFSWWED